MNAFESLVVEAIEAVQGAHKGRNGAVRHKKRGVDFGEGVVTGEHMRAIDAVLE